eukprot:895714_1
MSDFYQTIGIIYIVIQSTLALVVSVVGAIHVRRCIQEEKQHVESTVQLNEANPYQKAGDSNQKDTADPDHQSLSITRDNNQKDMTEITIKRGDNIQKDKDDDTGFIELWAKTIWKMRSVYSALAVHCFDVLTDILVIVQWSEQDDVPGDHINPQIMANCGIVVVIEAKVISTMAIFFKDKDIRRATLQFLDLLIFEEIYESHKKVVSQIKSKKSVTDKETAIESTLSFKYVRNYEAVFESIPQSVLQLVFIMRDSTSNIRPIFILSIIQSVISMTNSIINNDYTQMQDDKWKRYKKRFPPTFEFFKHAHM